MPDSYMGTRAEFWRNAQGKEMVTVPTDSPIILTPEEEPEKPAHVCQCRRPVMDRIAEHVRHARAKHPHWWPREEFVLSVAEMEFDEFCHAVKWETKHRAEEEALDLIAVLVRFLEGDGR